MFNEHKTFLTRLTSNQDTLKEYVKDNVDMTAKIMSLDEEVKANKVTIKNYKF